MQDLESALELATNSCVGGPLVENVHRLIKFRKDGFASAAAITRAVELRDRQMLVEAVNAGGLLMENESISLVPCLCDECYGWREAVHIGTEVRRFRRILFGLEPMQLDHHLDYRNTQDGYDHAIVFSHLV